MNSLVLRVLPLAAVVTLVSTVMAPVVPSAANGQQQFAVGAGNQGGHFSFSAHSGPNGEDPHGYVVDQGANGIRFPVNGVLVPYTAEGHVTCLTVRGNAANIGFEVERSNVPEAIGTGLILYVQDNGAPQNGQPVDHFNNDSWMITPPLPGQCQARYIAETPITQGNITIKAAR
jgi:hypothetical protein